MTISTARSGNAIFMDFNAACEASLVAVLNGAPVDGKEADQALLALGRCQAKIIEELKATVGTQRRGELRILYEGLLLANEFISQVKAKID